jgi:hypothetical protein
MRGVRESAYRFETIVRYGDCAGGKRHGQRLRLESYAADTRHLRLFRAVIRGKAYRPFLVASKPSPGGVDADGHFFPARADMGGAFVDFLSACRAGRFFQAKSDAHIRWLQALWRRSGKAR